MVETTTTSCRRRRRRRRRLAGGGGGCFGAPRGGRDDENYDDSDDLSTTKKDARGKAEEEDDARDDDDDDDDDERGGFCTSRVVASSARFYGIDGERSRVESRRNERHVRIGSTRHRSELYRVDSLPRPKGRRGREHVERKEGVFLGEEREERGGLRDVRVDWRVYSVERGVSGGMM